MKSFGLFCFLFCFLILPAALFAQTEDAEAGKLNAWTKNEVSRESRTMNSTKIKKFISTCLRELHTKPQKSSTALCDEFKLLVTYE